MEDHDVDQDSDDEPGDPSRSYAFPELDAQIRAVIKEYGAVFPKLNFSSPKARLGQSSNFPLFSWNERMQDAAWLLPSSSPLRCTSPADVYLLLKSSDFVTHDLSADSVFEGCVGGDGVSEGYQLELVLRKWFAIDPSREMRAFVRDGVLIGMCAFFYLLHGRVHVFDMFLEPWRYLAARHELLRVLG